MPIMPCPIGEFTQHIFDPILTQLVNRFIYRLGYKDVFGDRVVIKSAYNHTSDTSDGENNAQLRDNKFIADVMVQMQPDSTKWPVFNFNHTSAYGISSTSIKNQQLLFIDRAAKVSLWEQSSPCSVMLNCNMHFISKSLAYQTPYLIANRFLNGSLLEYHDLFYDYQLPMTAIYLLAEIHNLRGLTIDLYEYMRIGSEGNIGLDVNNQALVHKDKARPELVVNKSQIHCMYSVEHTDDQPNAEKTNSSTNGFTIPFTYTAQFNVPNVLFLEYPIIVNNKLLPQECIPVNMIDSPPAFTGSFAFKNINDFYNNYYKKSFGACFTIPFYEDWVPPTKAMPRLQSQEPIIIATTVIDNVNEKMTIDLGGDLGEGFKLNPILQDILKEQGEKAFLFSALFNISVYKDNYLLDRKELSLDENLVLSFYAREPLAIYRVVISQLQYLFNLPIELWDLAFKYRFFLGNKDTIKVLFNNRVPYWKNYTKYYFDNRTKGYYDKETKQLVFSIDEDGRMYRLKTNELNGWYKEYFDDFSYLPEGAKKYGSFTTLRVLNTDIRV